MKPRLLIAYIPKNGGVRNLPGCKLEDFEKVIRAEGVKIERVPVGKLTSKHSADLVWMYKFCRYHFPKRIDALRPPLFNVPFGEGKWHEHRYLRNAGCPVPDTILLDGNTDPRYVFKRLGSPLVTKPTHGTGGRDVNLVRAGEPLPHDERHIAQRYVKGTRPGDARLFVVGDKVVAAYWRTPKGRGPGLRTNLAYSTQREYFPGAGEVRTAVLATVAQGLSVSGVDMTVTSNGPLIYEVNPNPGLKIYRSAFGVDAVTPYAREVARCCHAAARGDYPRGRA